LGGEGVDDVLLEGDFFTICHGRGESER
jgi:hypothetical protein